ncbi:MAG: hypothetical protein PHF35_00115 [Candidatus Moranbacteria bacterium]|nr:hypothetical protein [Candidatus Moranbacteria bacterium]
MSDAHWMVVPPEKQEGQAIRGIDRLIEGKIRKWKKLNKQNFRLALNNAKQNGPFNEFIFLGDLVECVHNEKGMVTLTDLEEISILKKFVINALGLRFSGDDHYIPGDHELGYVLPLSLDPDGGMTGESITNFQNILGPMFDAWNIGNFIFITISSSLFTQFEWRNDVEIAELRQKQVKFLVEKLSKLPPEKKVFLFLHDPDAIEHINALPGASRITQIFCGHLHSENTVNSYRRLGKMANSFWGRLLLRFVGLIFNRLQRVNKVINWAKGNPYRLELFKKYNLQVVPAPNGMLGKGSGFLILELYADGNYEIKKFES